MADQGYNGFIRHVEDIKQEVHSDTELNTQEPLRWSKFKELFVDATFTFFEKRTKVYDVFTSHLVS